MSRRRYYVDWSDPPYPQIRLWSEGLYAEPETYAACKAEIMQTLQGRIWAARDYMAEVRRWRAADIDPNGE